MCDQSETGPYFDWNNIWHNSSTNIWGSLCSFASSVSKENVKHGCGLIESAGVPWETKEPASLKVMFLPLIGFPFMIPITILVPLIIIDKLFLFWMVTIDKLWTRQDFGLLSTNALVIG